MQTQQNITVGPAEPNTVNKQTLNTWLMLSPYGDWPHAVGMQRLSFEGAQKIVAQFSSVKAKLKRRFGGVPIYVGHPDDPAFIGQPGHGDTRAFGWVQALEARPEGLYMKARWSAEGRSMLESAYYRFLSPRWRMQKCADTFTFQPTQLVSIGLTNTPNIPGEAIANAQINAQKNDDEQPAQTTFTLNDANDANDASETSQTETLAEGAPAQPTIDAQLRAQADTLEGLAKQLEAKVRIQAEAIGVLEERLEAAMGQRNEAVVSKAVAQGRVKPSASNTLLEQLNENFEAANQRLETEVAIGTCIKTESITEGLRASNTALSHNPEALATLVGSHAKQQGTSFTQSWKELKRTQPNWFTQ